MDRQEIVARFWKGVDSHDWDLVASTLADEFTRVGMRADEADTCRGKANYLKFVSQVIGKMDHHDLKTRKTFLSADGRYAVVEAIETIEPPGQEPLSMTFLNVMELNDEGLLTKLDIFWKTPPRMPPDWITVDAVLSDSESS